MVMLLLKGLLKKRKYLGNLHSVQSLHTKIETDNNTFGVLCILNSLFLLQQYIKHVYKLVILVNNITSPLDFLSTTVSQHTNEIQYTISH